MIPVEGAPQVLILRDAREARVALARAGVSEVGMKVMDKRALFCTIRVSGLGIREVNILKQELTARGGDVAVSEDLFQWMKENGGCLLMGTLAQFERLLPRLKGPDTGLYDLADSIETALRNYSEPMPACHAGLRLEQAPLLMGILNVTPDSFSDGGSHRDVDAAVLHALEMVARGATFVDVGGESTRPGSEPVDELDEQQRVMPVIKALARPLHGRLSIDTCKARVAHEALAAGAFMVNDISALRADKGMVAVVRDAACPVVLMHMQGDPRTMQDAPAYRDVVGDVYAFFLERLNWAVDNGLSEENLLIDPGIGFGKTTAHNLELLRNLEAFKSLGRPIVVGASRKRFLGDLLGIQDARQRDVATAATTTMAVLAGAHIVRVHEIAGNREAAFVARAVLDAGAGRTVGP
jgi:dihydropteroate synthase